MSIVVLQLPKVKRQRETRPKKCAYCKGEILQRWGEVKKPVRDTKVRNVRVYRYKCCACKRTFRHYPEGVDRAYQTERLRKLAMLCWKLGLSYRGIEMVMAAFGVSLSRMSAWRDVQAEAQRQKKGKHWKPVRVLGLDGAYVLGWGEKRPALVAVDLGEGEPVAIGYINEHDPRAVKRWLEPIVKRMGVSVIVTDDLAAYRQVADDLNLAHQVCQFHVRRWVGKYLYKLRKQLPEKWLWVIEEIRQIIDDLPDDGDRLLYELWKKIPGRTTGPNQARTALERLRDLLIRLSEKWDRYTQFIDDPGIPWTNNGTEQVIGKMKMRARTVRGYKNWKGMHSGLMISGSNIN